MFIQFIELQNFRKLKSVRIDFSEETTVFVGANNSGKTSAMVALDHFLIDKTHFTTNDFTLSNWMKINQIGVRWEESGLLANWETEEMSAWDMVLPSLDLWLNVREDEIHHVLHLLPSIEWAGGLLGVRLRLQPKNIAEFYKEFITSSKAAKQTVTEAESLRNSKNLNNITHEPYEVSLWPNCMCQFLEKRLNGLFSIFAYNLDPTLIVNPVNGIAQPQQLPVDSLAIDEEPFKKLIRIDKIDAHRGFSNLAERRIDADGNESAQGEKGKLSEQLRTYYKKHIDPSNMPDPSDVDALDAIHKAQLQFDEKLQSGFKSKFDELESLGYPGVTDPRLKVSTKIKPVDGLNHSSALKYSVSSCPDNELQTAISLPEHYNGLGYQNLISMVFKLMSFRDDWMQVGKAGKKPSELRPIVPLHLVLVEEPEAHLHAQVQQVFIRKAYEVLRKHTELGEKMTLSTQLVVSTHSSHIAHECEFENLRYFRRKRAMENREVPISTVINLNEVFGKQNETARFVSRYIKSTHCDLFFADGAILVEGPSEHMLVPLFIREHFPELHQSYITLLEIGGSHAHRLKSLLDHLGLITLIITDLDAADPNGRHPSTQPKRKQNQITRNSTLKLWVPKKNQLDDLLDLPESEKELKVDEFYSIRVAYQVPVFAKLIAEVQASEVISNTFEDAFVFENLETLKQMNDEGLINLFKTAINESTSVDDLSQKLYECIRANTSKKAEFALNLLFHKCPEEFNIPRYINEGLSWLNDKIRIKQAENLTDAIALVTQEHNQES